MNSLHSLLLSWSLHSELNLLHSSHGGRRMFRLLLELRGAENLCTVSGRLGPASMWVPSRVLVAQRISSVSTTPLSCETYCSDSVSHHMPTVFQKRSPERLSPPKLLKEGRRRRL